MGKRGPRKEPTALQLLKGNPSKRLPPRHEPQPPADNIQPPDYLAGDSLDRWNQLVPQLGELGLLTNIDVEALARYCILHEQFLRYADQVRRGLDVMIVQTEAGRLKYAQVGPAATLLHKTLAAMLRLEQEFGLTPSARASLDVTPVHNDNPLKAFGITG